MAQGEVEQSGASQETSYLDLCARGGYGAVESRETRTTPFPPGCFILYFKPQFGVLTAARTLEAIRKGRWSDDDCTYVPFFRDDLRGRADVGPLWQMSVRGDSDMGGMFLICQGARLLRLTFAMPGPKDGAGPGIPFRSSIVHTHNAVQIGTYGSRRMQEQQHSSPLDSYTQDGRCSSHSCARHVGSSDGQPPSGISGRARGSLHQL